MVALYPWLDLTSAGLGAYGDGSMRGGDQRSAWYNIAANEAPLIGPAQPDTPEGVYKNAIGNLQGSFKKTPAPKK